MKQKIVIVFSVLLLLAVVYLISKDLFTTSTSKDENPCEYNIDKLKAIDSSQICYREILQFNPQMANIYGIAVDEAQTMYIAGNQQVGIYKANGTKTGGFRTDSSAHCIAVNGKDIFLGMGNHIEHYTVDGKKSLVWKAFNEKSYITSIVYHNNQLAVADAGNKRILKYDLSGNLLQELGKKDPAKGMEGFIIPSLYFEVAYGAFNDMWVVNPGRHRIENYSASGELQNSWGVASMQLDGFAGCCNPVHFAILPQGDFVTYEKGLDRIKIYDPTGKFQCVVAGPGSFKGKSDFHCSQATLVNDLATDANGNIYVLDAYNLVRVYARK